MKTWELKDKGEVTTARFSKDLFAAKENEKRGVVLNVEASTVSRWGT